MLWSRLINLKQTHRNSTLTTQASAAQPLQRDAIGVGFVLLSGLGVVFLPTTAKIAYLDGSNVLTVAFVRGVIGVVLLMLVGVAGVVAFIAFALFSPMMRLMDTFART